MMEVAKEWDFSFFLISVESFTWAAAISHWQGIRGYFSNMFSFSLTFKLAPTEQCSSIAWRETDGRVLTSQYPWCVHLDVVFSSQPTRAGADKHQRLQQSYLTLEWMSTALIHISDKSQMLMDFLSDLTGVLETLSEWTTKFLPKTSLVQFYGTFLYLNWTKCLKLW